MPNVKTADGRPPDNSSANLLERFRKSVKWGLLPPKLKQEMLSTGGKEPPAEYENIVERYYKRLSDYYDRRRR